VNLDVMLDFATSEMEAECDPMPDAGVDVGTAGHDGG